MLVGSVVALTRGDFLISENRLVLLVPSVTDAMVIFEVADRKLGFVVKLPVRSIEKLKIPSVARFTSAVPVFEL